MFPVAEQSYRIIKKRNFLFFYILINLIALVIRYTARDFISDDMQRFLIPWFQIIKSGGGLSALSNQVGDYGLLYQTIIALMTYVEMNPVYLYKLLSVIFDFLLANSFAYFVVNSGTMTDFRGKDKFFCLSYAFSLFLPTVIMNSAFWGQCDSIYTFFLLWCIWLLYKDEYKLSFFMLGCALAFKLQSILLFPLFFYSWFAKDKMHLSYFIITFFTYLASGLVAYFYGRAIFAGIDIYAFQVGEYKRMWANVPSFWALIEADYYTFFSFAIILTLVILGLGLYAFIKNGKLMSDLEQIIKLAIFIEWTCIIFLPAMHERYTYVLDLLLLMLSFLNAEYITYAFISIVTSCMTYSGYLFTGRLLNSWIIIIYIIYWLRYSYSLFANDICHRSS